MRPYSIDAPGRPILVALAKRIIEAVPPQRTAEPTIAPLDIQRNIFA